MDNVRKKPKEKSKGLSGRKSSIRTKLIVYPLILVFIAISIIGVTTSLLVRENLIDSKRESGYELIEQIKDRVQDNNASMENIEQTMEEDMKVAADRIISDREILSNEYLKYIGDITGISLVSWFSPEREIIFSNMDEDLGWVPPEDHPLTDFQKSDESVMMEGIRENKASEEGDFYKFGAIKSPDGSFIQLGINANKVNELTERFSYQTLVNVLAESDNIAYAGFLDPEGVIMADGDIEMVGKDVPNEAIFNAVRENKDAAILTTSFTGIEVYEIMSPIEKDGKVESMIKVAFDMTDTYKAINRNIMIIAAIGLLSFVVLSLVLIRISRSIVKNLENTKNSLSTLSNGDFTEEIPSEFLHQSDEFGEMALALKHLQESMRRVIGHIAVSSEKVTDSSERLFVASHESAIVSEEISNTVQEIANGANNQAEDTEKGSANINELGDLVASNKTSIVNLMDISRQVNSLKDEGLETIKELLSATNSNQESVSNINSLIMNTNTSAEKIENASQMIKSISEQTNLLALNAAIEAARAGDAGRGFAVVADEIRKLAEMSNKFTLEIEDIIVDLIEKTNDTVTTIKEVEESTERQAENVNITNDKFIDISKSIEEMIQALDKVNEGSNLMDDRKEQIIGVIENLSAISEENAAATQEASASAEEQMASVLEIENASDVLKSLAEEMNNNIAELKY